LRRRLGKRRRKRRSWCGCGKKADGSACNTGSGIARVGDDTFAIVESVVACVDHDGTAKDGEVTEESHLLGSDVQGSCCGSSIDLSKNVAEITDVADIISWGTMSHREWVVVTTSSSRTAAILGTVSVDVETVKTFEFSAGIVDLEAINGGLDSGRLASGLSEKNSTSDIIGAWAHDVCFGVPGWVCQLIEVISEVFVDLCHVSAFLPVLNAANDRCLSAIAVHVIG